MREYEAQSLLRRTMRHYIRLVPPGEDAVASLTSIFACQGGDSTCALMSHYPGDALANAIREMLPCIMTQYKCETCKRDLTRSEVEFWERAPSVCEVLDEGGATCFDCQRADEEGERRAIGDAESGAAMERFYDCQAPDW